MAFATPRGTWEGGDAQKVTKGPHEASAWRNPGDHHAQSHRHYETHTAASAHTTTAGLERHGHAGGLDPALHHDHGLLSAAHPRDPGLRDWRDAPVVAPEVTKGPHEASAWRNPGDHHAQSHRHYETHTAALAHTTTEGLEKHPYAGGHDPALHHDHGTATHKEPARKESGEASRPGHAEAVEDTDRPDSAGTEQDSWLMADLVRGLNARRRTKTNGKFVPAAEPRRRTEKPPSQAKSMVRPMAVTCNVNSNKR